MRASKSFLGNAAVLLCLLAIVIAFAAWQHDAWWNASPHAARWWNGAGVVAAYALLCGYFLRSSIVARAANPNAARQASTLVVWASQTGFAQLLAEHTVDAIGDDADMLALHQVDAGVLKRYRRALFIASTTGEGDPPDHALAFTRGAMAADRDLASLSYGVLALGDSNYGQFCGFGRALDQWLHRSGAQALFDRIDVDTADAGALRHWQHHLGQLSGRTDLPDWSAPRYSPWRLRQRRVLNAGSPGAPVHLLELASPDSTMPSWQAGDIAEIGPRHPESRVREWLEAVGVDGDTVVRDGESQCNLRELLSRSRLPKAVEAKASRPQAIADTLQALPHREYSIASIPGDGALHLLVREMHDEHGRPGLGSGWLTRHSNVGDPIDLRIRRNVGFHAPESDAPMILVGNGTGIAGLRALLKERATQGRRRNWLLFGERSAEHDAHHADELASWLEGDTLSRIDLAFSRSTSPSRLASSERLAIHPGYVQAALLANGDRLREWIGQGAFIHVCGSLAGMAPGVDAALRQVLGESQVEMLMTTARYRRDVY